MADIDTLLGLRASSPALSAALRGQLRGADVLGLSTMPQVSRLGQGQRRSVLAAATRAGRVKEAEKDRQESLRRWQAAQAREERREKESERRWNLTRARQAEQDRIAQERWQATHDLAVQKAGQTGRRGSLVTFRNDDGTPLHAQQGSDGVWRDPNGLQVDISGKPRWEDAKDTTKKSLKPGVAQQSAYLKSYDITERIRDLLRKQATLTPEQREQADSPWLESVIDFVTPEAFEQAAKETFLYTDPKVRAYTAPGAHLESEMSKMLSGLAVTKYEMRERKRWSPFAPGISDAERVQRMKTLLDATRRGQEQFRRMYPDYAPDLNDPDRPLPEVLERDDVGPQAPPEPPPQAPPLPARPLPQVGEVVDGREYLGGNPSDPASWGPRQPVPIPPPRPPIVPRDPTGAIRG